MNVKNKPVTEPAFQLKGSILTVSVLQLLTLDYIAFANQLEQLTQKNPNFFNHMPVVIDLQKLFSIDAEINFLEINSLLHAKSLVPVGIINANSKQIEAATKAGLAILPNVKATQASKTSNKIETSKIVTQPIRSGQQIYAKNSDLIILASVSNGAEVLADGNIHIYGSLRGRAIAGANGDTQARIFCQDFKAELIAIAGHYKLQDDIKEIEISNAQVFLENDQLVITALNF